MNTQLRFLTPNLIYQMTSLNFPLPVSTGMSNLPRTKPNTFISLANIPQALRMSRRCARHQGYQVGDTVPALHEIRVYWTPPPYAFILLLVKPLLPTSSSLLILVLSGPIQSSSPLPPAQVRLPYFLLPMQPSCPLSRI